MYKRAREEFAGYQQFLRNTRPRIDRSTVTVRRGYGVSKRRGTAIRPRAVLYTGGLLPAPSNVERKFLDSAISDDATTTGAVNLLNGMAPGTTASTRIGQRILMKSIQARIYLRREDVTTATVQAVRVLLIYDRQTNGAAPAITDVLSAISMQSLRNMANVGRFFCLMDKTYTLDGAGGQTVLFDERYMKINLPVFYNTGTAGTAADIQTGGLFLMHFGNAAAGVDDTDANINIRLRFTDM